MYSSSSEVNEMVDAFADLFERSRVQFTSSYDMSTALNSMQGLSSNAPSTRRLMALVSKALSTVNGRCEARDISMTLYGLKELSSTHNETLSLLAQVGKT